MAARSSKQFLIGNEIEIQSANAKSLSLLHCTPVQSGNGILHRSPIDTPQRLTKLSPFSSLGEQTWSAIGFGLFVGRRRRSRRTRRRGESAPHRRLSVAGGSDSRCNGIEEPREHLLYERGAAMPQSHRHTGRVLCFRSVQGKYIYLPNISIQSSTFLYRLTSSDATRLTRESSALRESSPSSWPTC